jgi:cytochrome c5
VKDMKAKMPAPPPAPAAEAAPQQVAAAPAGGAAPAKAADGKTTYDTTCMACHGTGAAGAPKLGDKAAWAPRLKQGAAALHASATQGQGRDAAEGRQHTLSDDAVKAAVDYMVAAAEVERHPRIQKRSTK